MKTILLATACFAIGFAALPAAATPLPKDAMVDPDNPERIILHPTPMQRHANTPGYDDAGIPMDHEIVISKHGRPCSAFYTIDCKKPALKPATAPAKIWPVDL